MTKVESTEGINIFVNENQNAFVIANESSNINSEFAHNKIHIDQTTIKNDNIIIQQDNNVSKITNNNISVENNQSKISLEPGKININNNGDTSNIVGSQFSGNAASADKLNTDAGSALHPIYFKNGIPVETTYNLNIAGAELGLVKSGGNVTISNGIINVNDDEHNHIIDNIDGLQEALDNKMDKNIGIEGYLPLTAGEEYKLTGPLGLTHEIGYGSTLPTEGFEGQLFFLEAESTIKGLPSGGEIGQTLIKNSLNDGDVRWGTIDTLPAGGEPGQALIKNSTNTGDASWQDIVALPKGGTGGEVLVKNTNLDGDASWQELVALPKGGAIGQVLVKNSTADGDAKWTTDISGNASTATKLQNARTITLSGDVTGSASFDGSNNVTINNGVLTPMSGIYHDLFAFNNNNYTQSFYTTTDGTAWNSETISNIPFDQKDMTTITLFSNSIIGYRWQWFSTTLAYNGATSLLTSWHYKSDVANINIVVESSKDGESWLKIGQTLNETVSSEWVRTTLSSMQDISYLRITMTKNSGGDASLSSIKLMTPRPGSQGCGRESEYPYTWDADKNITGRNKIYGAVYNDYAEYRTQKEAIEPGYCVASTDNGELFRTTEKFQACDGIVSDTFGFAIGETQESRTPIAVAGRVLAYCAGDKNSYHSGDTVCAGPGGLVYKMTREEIREWPDRIVGVVSEIPSYDTWGTGNIKVNNRIWIKIK